jgi:hypothetical protein
MVVAQIPAAHTTNHFVVSINHDVIGIGVVSDIQDVQLGQLNNTAWNRTA